MRNGWSARQCPGGALLFMCLAVCGAACDAARTGAANSRPAASDAATGVGLDGEVDVSVEAPSPVDGGVVDAAGSADDAPVDGARASVVGDPDGAADDTDGAPGGGDAADGGDDARAGEGDRVIGDAAVVDAARAKGDAASVPSGGGDPVTRGSYLVRAVLACGNCHSPLPAAGAAADPSAFLGGRECFARVGRRDGLGTTCLAAPNLTPDATGIGRYSDAQLTAMILDGVRADGTPIAAAFMPSYQFHLLTDEDAASVVAYLRSLPPVTRAIPRRDHGVSPASFESPLSMDDLPAANPLAGPAGERGRYLAAIACVACHSPHDETTLLRPIDAARAYSGGQMYVGVDRVAHAPNLTTADPAAQGAHAEAIVRAMRSGIGRDGLPLCGRMPGGPGQPYAQLSDDDAYAIANYLASLPPRADVVSRVCDAP